MFEEVSVEPQTSIGRVVFYKQKLQRNPSAGEITSIGVRFFGVGAGGVGGATSFSKISNATTNTTTKNTSPTKSTTNDNGSLNSNITQQNNTGYIENSCRDGIDNDRDGFIDWRDSGCHMDGDVNNMSTYNGTLSEVKSKSSTIDSTSTTTGSNTKSTTTNNTQSTSTSNTNTTSGTNSYKDLVGGSSSDTTKTNTTKTQTNGSKSINGCNPDIWGADACQ